MFLKKQIVFTTTINFVYDVGAMVSKIYKVLKYLQSKIILMCCWINDKDDGLLKVVLSNKSSFLRIVCLVQQCNIFLILLVISDECPHNYFSRINFLVVCIHAFVIDEFFVKLKHITIVVCMRCCKTVAHLNDIASQAAQKSSNNFRRFLVLHT